MQQSEQSRLQGNLKKVESRRRRRGRNHPKPPLSSTSTGKALVGFLFQPGNIGLARLLFALYHAGEEGSTTNKLLQQLGSTNYAQAFIKRAKKEEGLINKRIPEDPPAPDEFLLRRRYIISLQSEASSSSSYEAY
jgi:hypothetical protein